jgi:hypothetical protein
MLDSRLTESRRALVSALLRGLSLVAIFLLSYWDRYIAGTNNLIWALLVFAAVAVIYFLKMPRKPRETFQQRFLTHVETAAYVAVAVWLSLTLVNLLFVHWLGTD